MKKIIIAILVISIIVSAGIFGFYKYKESKKEINTTKKEEVSQVNNEVELKEPEEIKDPEIFDEFYDQAEEKLETLTLDEKIGQMLLVRLPDQGAITELQKYNFGGYLLFAKDFKNKSEQTVKNEIASYQEASKIPLLIAADEEGGTVVRISSNPNLVSQKFKSPSKLYGLGGFDRIREDTIEKSNILSNLGVNLNLAPVVDVSTNSRDFMYQRALGQNAELTAEYAKTVIEASKGYNVSYTLKHFPGYGNNADTHTGAAIDSRTYENIMNNDIVPFKNGIESGAEAVLVSHNIVTSIDGDNAASISESVHKLLREDLKFSGIIITDDLYMGAVSNDPDVAAKAVIAGNDMLIVTDYEKAINNIKSAIEEERITEEQIDTVVRRIIAWKYYKKLM